MLMLSGHAMVAAGYRVVAAGYRIGEIGRATGNNARLTRFVDSAERDLVEHGVPARGRGVEDRGGIGATRLCQRAGGGARAVMFTSRRRGPAGFCS